MPVNTALLAKVGNRMSCVQEPRLTTAETSKTPLTLLLAFPKSSENEHRPKVMRCAHKPPEETALTGEALVSVLRQDSEESEAVPLHLWGQVLREAMK